MIYVYHRRMESALLERRMRDPTARSAWGCETDGRQSATLCSQRDAKRYT